MADTKIEDLTDGTTANATDRIPVTRDPTGTPVNRYVTPAYIRSLITGQSNNWSGAQNIVPSSNTTPFSIAGHTVNGANTNNLMTLTAALSGSAALSLISLSANLTGFTGSQSTSRLLTLLSGTSPTEKFGVSFDGSIFTPGGVINSDTGSITFRTSAGSNFARLTNGGNLFRQYVSLTSSGFTEHVILENTGTNGLLEIHNKTTSGTVINTYHTRDASVTNYTRLSLKSATAAFSFEAESGGTGSADIDIKFVPKGTGLVWFGAHSVIGAETVTGFITIKDAAGNSRKLAVVS